MSTGSTLAAPASDDTPGWVAGYFRMHATPSRPARTPPQAADHAALITVTRNLTAEILDTVDPNTTIDWHQDRATTDISAPRLCSLLPSQAPPYTGQPTSRAFWQSTQPAGSHEKVTIHRKPDRQHPEAGHGEKCGLWLPTFRHARRVGQEVRHLRQQGLFFLGRQQTRFSTHVQLFVAHVVVALA